MNVKYIIFIPNDNERFVFAQECRKIFDKSKTYSPQSNESDIGIQASISEDQLTQLIYSLDTRGYSYKLIKE
jgi:hypothetical protein